MNNNLLEYKGYHTRVEFDVDTHVLIGRIEGISDYVDFEAHDLRSVEKEFHNAVDDYLEFCKSVGKKPEKEYKGLFNVRVLPELHKKLAIRAFKDNCSLNTEVEKAIAFFLSSTAESAD